jgi:hypothetical protein
MPRDRMSQQSSSKFRKFRFDDGARGSGSLKRFFDTSMIIR